MRDWGLSDDAEGLHHFCGVVMDAAADRIAVQRAPVCSVRVYPNGAIDETSKPVSIGLKSGL
jgi:hypothetical protein